MIEAPRTTREALGIDPPRPETIRTPIFPLPVTPPLERLHAYVGCGLDDECRAQHHDRFAQEDHPERTAASFLAYRLVNHFLPPIRFTELADGLVCGKRQERANRQCNVVTELLLDKRRRGQMTRDRLYEAANEAHYGEIFFALVLTELTRAQVMGDAPLGEGVPLPLEEYRRRKIALKCDFHPVEAE